VEGFEAQKKEKLDNQLKEFMAKAQEQKDKPAEATQAAGEQTTAREVVEQK
jgi:hypothetical protein